MERLRLLMLLLCLSDDDQSQILVHAPNEMAIEFPPEAKQK